MKQEIDEIKKNLDIINQRGALVVKDNELIQKAQFCLTPTQQKVVCYVISLIRPEDKLFTKYSISIKDFAELCGISPKHAYSEFKSMIDDLDKKAFWIHMDGKKFKFRWFTESTYIDGKGQIQVMLHSELQSYLLQLRTNFTQYELWNILALKSKWSIRLYELFKSYQYQHRITFDYDNLKELLGAESYKNFNDFKRRILDKAKDEINQFTDIDVDYELITIKKSHRVKDIIFIIDKKGTKEGFLAYRKTIDKINQKNNKKELKGQLSFDLEGNIQEET